MLGFIFFEIFDYANFISIYIILYIHGMEADTAASVVF